MKNCFLNTYVHDDINLYSQLEEEQYAKTP